MPFYLDDTDVVPEVARFKSVLIVPCRFHTHEITIRHLTVNF